MISRSSISPIAAGCLACLCVLFTGIRASGDYAKCLHGWSSGNQCSTDSAIVQLGWEEYLIFPVPGGEEHWFSIYDPLDNTYYHSLGDMIAAGKTSWSVSRRPRNLLPYGHSYCEHSSLYLFEDQPFPDHYQGCYRLGARQDAANDYWLVNPTNDFMGTEFSPVDPTGSNPAPGANGADPQGGESEANPAEVGDPVNVINGSVSVSETDLLVPCPGFDLHFRRSYDSARTSTDTLGPGWIHSIRWSIAETNQVMRNDGGDPVATNQYAILHTSDGQELAFRFRPDVIRFISEVPFEYEFLPERYYAPPGNRWTLDGGGEDPYTLDFPGGVTYSFTTNGTLTDMRDAFSNTVTLVYTNSYPNEQLTRVEHDNGQFLSLSYNPSGLVEQVDCLDTNIYLTFDYNSSGLLTNAVRHGALSGEQTKSYAYDATGLLTQRVNFAGTTTHWQYDAQGRATNSLVAGIYHPTSVDYSQQTAGVSVVTIDRGDLVVTNTYEYRTDLERVVAIETDGGERTEHTINLIGDLTHISHASASASDRLLVHQLYDSNHNPTNRGVGYNAAPSDFWQFTWETNWNQIASITDPEQHRVELDYTNGLLLASRLILDSNTAYQTDFSYTDDGLLEAVTNANGHFVHHTYDSYGYANLIQPQVGPTIDLDHNALGHLTRISVPGETTSRVTTLIPDEIGRAQTVTYPNGLDSEYIYDATNLRTNIDTAGRIASYEYEPLGRLRSATRYLVEGSSSQAVTIAMAYDATFNTLSITDPLDREVEAYQFDVMDRAVRVTNVENQVMLIDYEVGSYIDQLTRFEQSAVDYGYNSDGHLSQVAYTDETNSFTYYQNGLLQTASNSVSGLSSGYSTINRLTQTVAKVSASALAWTNTYAYAPAGQVTNTTTVAGSVSYAYDEAERITNLTDSVAGVFEYQYNPYNGLVDTLDYPNGLACTYKYDVMDRLTNITYSAGTNPALSLAYLYNEGTGMITNILRESGMDQRFGYDTLDRLTSETLHDAEGAELDSSTYGYDLAGNRTNKTRSGIAVDYSLGSGNRLASWAVSGATLTSAFISVSGHASEAIGADPRFGERTVNGAEATISGTNFWLEIPVESGTQSLAAAMGDLAGNLGYDTNEVALTIITNAVYGHDLAGNLTNINYNSGVRTLALTWNQHYQLQTVSTSGLLAESYTYDALGRRLTTTRSGSTICHLYDGIHCNADTDSNGAPLRTYCYGPGIDNPLAMTVHGSAETNTYYYLTDHLGSVLALSDELGTLVETYHYDAWGRVSAFDAAGIPLSESAYGNRITFQGREHSWATGLTYFRARWYDPITGRWLSKDPVGISGGLNQYAFCGNNPVNFVDKDGESAIAAAEYWAGMAGSGYNQGGVAGWFKVQTGNTMGMFINMWHAQEIESHADSAGKYWDESRAKSVKHLASVGGYSTLNYVQFAGLSKLGQVSSLDPMRLNGAVSPGARTQAQNLGEQILLNDARAGGGRRIMKEAIKDPLFPAKYYAKMQAAQGGATIHYWKNLVTRSKFGFKFVAP